MRRNRQPIRTGRRDLSMPRGEQPPVKRFSADDTIQPEFSADTSFYKKGGAVKRKGKK